MPNSTPVGQNGNRPIVVNEPTLRFNTPPGGPPLGMGRDPSTSGGNDVEHAEWNPEQGDFRYDFTCPYDAVGLWVECVDETGRPIPAQVVVGGPNKPQKSKRQYRATENKDFRKSTVETVYVYANVNWTRFSSRLFSSKPLLLRFTLKLRPRIAGANATIPDIRFVGNYPPFNNSPKARVILVLALLGLVITPFFFLLGGGNLAQHNIIVGQTKRIASQNHTIEDQARSLTEVRQQQQEAEGRVDAIQNELDKSEKNVESLSTKINQLTASVAQQKEQARQANGRNTDLIAQIRQKEAKISELKRQYQQEQSYRKKVQDALVVASGKLKAANSRIATLSKPSTVPTPAPRKQTISMASPKTWVTSTPVVDTGTPSPPIPTPNPTPEPLPINVSSALLYQISRNPDGTYPERGGLCVGDVAKGDKIYFLLSVSHEEKDRVLTTEISFLPESLETKRTAFVVRSRNDDTDPYFRLPIEWVIPDNIPSGTYSYRVKIIDSDSGQQKELRSDDFKIR